MLQIKNVDRRSLRKGRNNELSLCLSGRKMGDKWHSCTLFLISTLDGGKCSVSRPYRFYPQGQPPVPYLVGPHYYCRRPSIKNTDLASKINNNISGPRCTTM